MKASITRIAKNLRDLESKADDPSTLDHAQRIAKRLEELDLEFKEHHGVLIDLIGDDDEDVLEKEQEALDEHDDEVSLLTVRVQKLVSVVETAPDPNACKIFLRRLALLQRTLSPVRDAIDALSGDSDDICLLRHHEEQLSDIKKELQDVRTNLVKLDLEDGDDLNVKQADLQEELSQCSLTLKRILNSRGTPSATTDRHGVKLPKLDIPTFDGSILNWRSFWEQFCISVHDRTTLSDSEKLVYLKQSLKGGSAKQTIEGLSRSGDNYGEAIECLKARYDRPRLIHEAHVRAILEAPSLKDGSGKELRHLHDITQQHLRALKSIGYEPSGPFITSVIELKLDTTTRFEWQKQSQSSTDVPDFHELLDFLNLHAQASETSVTGKKAYKEEAHHAKRSQHGKFVTSFVANAGNEANCFVCKTDQHPLYCCTKFKSLPHDRMLSTLKDNNICINCMRPGHFVRQCRSLSRCKKCQKSHHTLLHLDTANEGTPAGPTTNPSEISIPSCAARGIASNSLLMTCRVRIDTPDGSTVEARGLLDSASSASFISERLAQSLCLHRTPQSARISGVAGLTHNSSMQSITNFTVSPVLFPDKKFDVTAVVVPRVTCNLPIESIHFDPTWNHLSGLHLADPRFASPGRIDLLLGVDVFVDSILPGRRIGPLGSPTALETHFGWVLAGRADSLSPTSHIATHHTSIISGDELLRKFWELEETPMSKPVYSPEERVVVEQFKATHHRAADGMFVVPLPRKQDAMPLGESRSQAVRRFLSLERALHSKGQFKEVHDVIQEYFDLGHAEPVPVPALDKPMTEVFYLPIYIVRKDSSSTTKVRAVFDGSAMTSTGVSLNKTFLVGPTVHPPLIDILLQFRMYRVALTTDVSKMYRAVGLTESDKDLHRFVWRSGPQEVLQDFRMTRITFGIAASSFAANMCVKQNASDFAQQYPLAAKAVDKSFYVDDGLAGADSAEETIDLQDQLQKLFGQGGFLLRKWNCSEQAVLQHIPSDLRDSQSTLSIPFTEEYTKTLGVEWNSNLDHLRLTFSQPPSLEKVTKCGLISDVAKTFDVLGWFSPAIIKVKILFQRLWEMKVDWDDPVPSSVHEPWLQWRSELHLLSKRHIPRCYFPKDAHISTIQLHGFSDASENAYAGVAYLRMVDTEGRVHVSLVMSKTKVAPIKRLTIPRLELCGAHLLAQILHHTQELFHITPDNIFAWTDSTIVLGWLSGNPRRFKTYVGNRISGIMECVSPDRWNHVNGFENPADCASRGLFPSELLEHTLWWDGPKWLSAEQSSWPKQSSSHDTALSDEEREICFLTTVVPTTPVITLDRYSSFTRMKHVTAWVCRFVNNCRAHKQGRTKIISSPFLTVPELVAAQNYWIRTAQLDHFTQEIESIKKDGAIPNSSRLLPYHPFLDSDGILRVGGREHNSDRSFSNQHPIILHGTHPVTKLLIHLEHLRLLHAGPTLLASSLSTRFHIIGGRKIIRSITRGCIICRRDSARPRPQMLGQLPVERITPSPVFNKVGVDYAGPINVKHGYVRKPTVVKAYICVFVCLSTKAVHLELVSDLTTDAFMGTLRRFIAHQGKPSLIWSDNGTNFVGASRELRELALFLSEQKAQGDISDFCSSQCVTWSFIPERSPHFGGLWEAAVKSLKTHLRRVTANVTFTFEELTTILTQIEACLNSRPLVPICSDDDGMEALTPGHFLIGRPLESIPDVALTYRSISLLRRWHLCQGIATLRRFTKWNYPSRNASVEDNVVPAKWPLARIVKVHPSQDGLVRVVSVKTGSGVYKRPITKIALIKTKLCNTLI